PAGAAASGLPVVTVRDAETGELKFQVMPYENTYHGGVQVAVGDLNNDGLPDITTSPGSGHEPVAVVYNGTPDAFGYYRAAILTRFDLFSPSFLGGAVVAVGDVNRDGNNDLVAAAGAGWLPRVVVFDGSTVLTGHALLGTPFNGMENTYRGGLSLA